MRTMKQSGIFRYIDFDGEGDKIEIRRFKG